MRGNLYFGLWVEEGMRKVLVGWLVGLVLLINLVFVIGGEIELFKRKVD